jgi:hypothetical protein
MKATENKAILFEALKPKLVADDDRTLWQAALFALTEEFAQRQADESEQGDWAMVVGACSRNASLSVRLLAIPIPAMTDKTAPASCTHQNVSSNHSAI